MNRERYQLSTLQGGLHLALAPIKDKTNQKRRAAEVATTQKLLTHSLRSLGLSDQARLEYTDSGAPLLVGPREGLSISISHSEDWVAILLGGQELTLGIDIEPRRRQVERIEHKFASEVESALLNDLGSHRLLGLQLLWSAKESLYKCLQPPSLSLLAFELTRVDISSSQGELASVSPLGSAEYIAKMTFQYLESRGSHRVLNVEGIAFADHVLCYTHSKVLCKTNNQNQLNNVGHQSTRCHTDTP